MTAWKPGDIMRPTAQYLSMTYVGHGLWRWTHEDARPLVVIDPEDTNDLAHDVARRLGCRPGEDISHIKEALKGALTPAPPRPDEPTGLGAVVRDGDGTIWTRTEPANADCTPWTPSWTDRSDDVQPDFWNNLHDVTVLSPGVEVES